MLCADYREPEVLIQLLNTKTKVTVMKLDCADYAIGDIGIERKTISDFLNSLASKRLYEQLGRLKRAYAYPYLLVEGLIDWSYFTNPHWVCSVLQNSVLAGIPIIFTYNTENTADILIRLSKCRVANIPAGIVMPQKQSQPQLSVLCSFPGIGEKRGLILLNHFKTLRTIFAAKRNELRTAGLGRKTTKTMQQLLDKSYE